MKKIYAYMINFALLFLSSSAQGIFYNATEFVAVNGSQTIICLGDAHNLCEDSGFVAQQQREDLPL